MKPDMKQTVVLVEGCGAQVQSIHCLKPVKEMSHEGGFCCIAGEFSAYMGGSSGMELGVLKLKYSCFGGRKDA
jgi:hypothetical protein